MSARGAHEEIELKLVLPGPETGPAVIDLLRRTGYAVEPAGRVVNDDLYLDTFEWTLRRKGLSLRYRAVDGKPRFCLKSTGGIEGAVARRTEREVSVKRPVRDPATGVPKPLRKTVEKATRPRRLLEQVRVVTDRERYDVTDGAGNRFELAFDRSTFSLRGLNPRRRSVRAHELEVELVAGEPAALDRVRELLDSAFGFAPSGASKLEAAISRLRVSVPSKTPPERLRVAAGDRFDVAVRKILTHQAARYRMYLPGVRDDIDTEFVHQARVATRRMRSALRLFSGALPEKTAGAFAGELKWLGSVFGEMRDLDVFLLNLEGYRKQLGRFPKKQRRILRDWIEKHRRAPLERLVEAIDSRRATRFLERLDRTLARPVPRRPRAPLARQTVGEAAPGIILSHYDAVAARGRAVAEKPSPKRYHRLRIEAKKLRYACEFVSPAYDDRLDEFIALVVEVQDCLGELQDTVFTRKFVSRILEDWKGKVVDPELVFILGEIVQLQVAVAAERRAAFPAIWERFAAPERFAELRGILGVPAGE